MAQGDTLSFSRAPDAAALRALATVPKAATAAWEHANRFPSHGQCHTSCVHLLAPWLPAHPPPCSASGQPAPVTLCTSALESRTQLVVTCSAAQLLFPSSSCWALGYVWGKSLGEAGAACTPSRVWPLFSVVAHFSR